MRKPARPYHASLLPAGFKYPKAYISQILNLDDLYSIPCFSWEFIDDPNGEGLDYHLRLEKFKEYDCIPFARNFDWIASFIGIDTNENPRFFVLDLGNF